MSVIDEVIKANEKFARRFALRHLSPPPARRLAVVACMDDHSDCGMLTFTDADLRPRLRRETGAAPVTPGRFYTFSDLVRSRGTSRRLVPGKSRSARNVW